MNRHQSRFNAVAGVLVTLLLVYVVSAFVVFRLRHPWMTETELLLCPVATMTFQKVPYEAMRPREPR